MKQLLYYDLDNSFVTEQRNAGGDGSKVVSVYNGVAWTEDSGVTYYRDNVSQKVTYTVTIHYRDIWGGTILPDETMTVGAYAGKSTNVVVNPKNIENYTLENQSRTVEVTGNTEHTIVYIPKGADELLTFEILEGGYLAWIERLLNNQQPTLGRVIEYSINGGAWQSKSPIKWSSFNSGNAPDGARIYVNTGDVVRLRGNNATYCEESVSYADCFCGSTAKFKARGNIMSLISATNFSGLSSFASSFTFSCLFDGASGLTDISELILPATGLTEGCYYAMFCGTAINSLPRLGATILAKQCYQGMFQSCKQLVDISDYYLPATVMAQSCYSGMFNQCGNMIYGLKELPATTLATSCYYGMFESCGKLKEGPRVLPAATLAENCYASMFGWCYSLEVAPELPATTLATRCYYSMFLECSGLTEAPLLPAENVSYHNAYSNMFAGCKSLKYIKSLATNITSLNNVQSFATNVASGGTFVRSYPDTAGWVVGSYGIPAGWAIIDSDKEECYNEYLTMEILTDGAVRWRGAVDKIRRTIEYSKNGGEWTSITNTSDGVYISVVAGDEIRFRGDNSSYFVWDSVYQDDYYLCNFMGTTCDFNLRGNLLSLANSTAFSSMTENIPCDFTEFFSYSNVIDASKLVIRRNVGTGLFMDSKLTYPPVLAVAMDANYDKMFKGCTHLINSPILTGTFTNTSGVGANRPRFSGMFSGCTNLTGITCVTSNLPSMDEHTSRWVDGVAQNGTFYKTYALDGWTNNTGTYPNSGVPAGWTITTANL